MSPVRYRREGLRIVRVEGTADSPHPDWKSEAPPSLAEADDYRLRLHRFAQDVRGAVRRYRRPTGGVTPELLSAARRLDGRSQRRLAAALGISRSSISEGETGGRPIHPVLADWARRVLRERGGRQP